MPKDHNGFDGENWDDVEEPEDEESPENLGNSDELDNPDDMESEDDSGDTDNLDSANEPNESTASNKIKHINSTESVVESEPSDSTELSEDISEVGVAGEKWSNAENSEEWNKENAPELIYDNEYSPPEKDWSEMNHDEKLEHLQKLEYKNAEADGRDIRDVVIGEDLEDHERGQYDHEKNPDQISINEKDLDNKENSENIVSHEGRHATQHDVVDGKIDGEKAGIDDKLKQELKEDFESEHPDRSENAERSRPSERDAREYAADKAPDAEISKSDVEAYETMDSVDRIEAIGEQNAADFEAFENGEQNHFSPGGYEDFSDIVEPSSSDGIGNNGAESSTPIDDIESSDYPGEFRDIKEPGAEITHGEFMDAQTNFEKSIESGNTKQSEVADPPPEPPPEIR